MTTVSVVYHSGYGHTKAIAESVQKGAASVAGTTVNFMAVDAVDWDALNASHAIIFGSPTYMGGPSGQFKTFADATSKAWFTGAWKDKIAAGFTVSSSRNGDKASTLSYFQTLAMQHHMLWVGTGMMPGNNSSKGSEADLNRLGASAGLMAQGNSDQGVEGIHESDFRTAEAFGKRVAEATARWNK
ncbi:MAG: flavodoxin family protein [Betaproteobacteria bacterium]|nr:MAG: flavodoxin family protein [Betaproteobacteria bacterium]